MQKQFIQRDHDNRIDALQRELLAAAVVDQGDAGPGAVRVGIEVALLTSPPSPPPGSTRRCAENLAHLPGLGPIFVRTVENRSAAGARLERLGVVVMSSAATDGVGCGGGQ